MKTLVVHLSDPTTDFLKPIYEGRPWSVLRYSVSSKAVVEAARAHDRVIMLGHGSPRGLFGTGGFAVDSTAVKALAGKPNVYIWCHAGAFVERHGLAGFYTGMFISEVGEAAFCQVPATQEEVDASNEEFVAIVARHIDETPGAIYQAVKRDYFAGRLVAEYNRDLVGFQ